MKFRIICIFLFVFSLNVFAGAWGSGSFENDDASDWIYEFERSTDTVPLLSTIREAFRSDYIEANACSKVIAAAEVVASLKDGDIAALPKELSNWVVAKRSQYEPEMSKFALRAVQACQDSVRSELAQLWAEGTKKEWESNLKVLEARLK